MATIVPTMYKTVFDNFWYVGYIKGFYPVVSRDSQSCTKCGMIKNPKCINHDKDTFGVDIGFMETIDNAGSLGAFFDYNNPVNLSSRILKMAGQHTKCVGFLDKDHARKIIQDYYDFMQSVK